MFCTVSREQAVCSEKKLCSHMMTNLMLGNFWINEPWSKSQNIKWKAVKNAPVWTSGICSKLIMYRTWGCGYVGLCGSIFYVCENFLITSATDLEPDRNLASFIFICPLCMKSVSVLAAFLISSDECLVLLLSLLMWCVHICNIQSFFFFVTGQSFYFSFMKK